MSYHHTTHEAGEHQRWRPTFHQIIGIGALIVLIVFGILNRGEVKVDVIFDTVNMRLIVVIAIAAVLAFLVGWSLGRRR
jgi:uncharacterized integral membrane protein